MSTLWLSDVQYHFRGLDPDDVSVHAYNVLTYMFDNNCHIESGDHIDGRSSFNIKYKDSEYAQIWGKFLKSKHI